VSVATLREAAEVSLAVRRAAAQPGGPVAEPVRRIARVCDGERVSGLARAAEVVTAAGRIHGVPSRLFATDPRTRGGALSAEGCAAIAALYAEALAADEPVIGIWQSGGARLDEGADSLHGVGLVFAAMTRASGRIPQISLVLGAAAGGAAYGPALTDVVVMTPDARVFVTGPDIVRPVTGEDVDAATLGGPEPHSKHSGVAHVAAPSEESAVARVRELVSFLARPAARVPVAVPVRAEEESDDPGAVLPDEPRRAYDVHPLLTRILDGPPLELQPKWAPNVVTAFGRLEGRAVGVIATNPLRLGGCLTALSSDKAARFVRLCDAFGVPLVVVVDVPGYLPGVRAEHDGIVRRGAKLVHAFAAASVPRITVVTRKAYGGAYIALNSRSLGATRVFAWPGAQVDVMAAPAAVKILHRRALEATDPRDRPEEEARLAVAHQASTGGLNRALANGYVDEVIEPRDTRRKLIECLAEAGDARGSHTNIPL
jgi:acetyl-CoA/propionyl-CoA carboxylase carboxyl transferase subunit